MNLLQSLDYSVLQQCMHCGMCLPTCPTYVETKRERNSPRGRISLMRSVADGELSVTKSFSDEMYYCLGCLACQTACPAGVNYAELFETARAEVERSGVRRHLSGIFGAGSLSRSCLCTHDCYAWSAGVCDFGRKQDSICCFAGRSSLACCQSIYVI